MAWACCSANITAITRPGRRKNTPATMARTSLLPCIRAMASFHAALMLNFMPIPPQRMRPTLDKLESNRQQIAPMENSNTLAAGTIEWRRSTDPVPYRAALAEQQSRNEAIAAGEAGELVWLLEHPPVYTAGTSAVAHEVLDARFEVVETGRGGRHTYHGPGQRVGYVLLDLNRRGRDVRRFVHALEGWVVATLGAFGVEAWAVPDRIGIWTRDIDGAEAKIGAIGVRVRRWVTMHGFAVNLDPDLSHFVGIVPCGIADYGITSLARLGLAVGAEEWDGALRSAAGDFLAALEAPE